LFELLAVQQLKRFTEIIVVDGMDSELKFYTIGGRWYFQGDNAAYG